MKRRRFLKTVGGATGATALGLQKVLAQKKQAVLFVRNHKEQTTYGMGDARADHDPDTFKLRRRMPAWFPDASKPTADDDYLFPEETVQYANRVPRAINLPVTGKPTVTQLLGGKYPNENLANPFVSLIRALADKARMYNITLYELRRFHYCKKFNIQLPPNKYGKQPALPQCNAADFITRAQTAEGNFTAAAKALDLLIDNGGYGLPVVAIDMVRVNDYIVSMRVVARHSTTNDVRILEIGGSDSSHVSISSAFSSP